MKGEAPANTLGIRAVDDYTFEVTLEKPVPFFIKLLSHPVLAPPYRRKSLSNMEPLGHNRKNIVTNGAFTVSDWKVNEKMVMVKKTANIGMQTTSSWTRSLGCQLAMLTSHSTAIWRARLTKHCLSQRRKKSQTVEEVP
ncbi:ABC transporter substrate-binding protein [Vibrio sinaloensis]|nr:ABC transporter substrate-binding protein [Vibrio sinaloensis]